jgi:biopolymer transport protein ExbD
MKIDYLDDPNQNVHIEILPLIDVIFCILTFFYPGGCRLDPPTGH